MYNRMLKEIFESTKVFKFCWVLYTEVCSRISFSGVSYCMEVSQLVCDGDLLTGSCAVLAFPVSNFWFITSSSLFTFIQHPLQNQEEMALQKLIATSVSIVATSINIA